NGDGIARMNPHRVEILNRADNDDIVLQVAHHLELELFPSDDGFFNQHLVHRTEVQAVLNNAFKLFAVEGNASTRPAERKRRPDDGRKSDALNDTLGLANIADDVACRSRKSDFAHGLFEK